MKPIIVTKGADGKLDLTEEQLDKLIDCAYHSGYADGLRAGQPLTPNAEPYNPWSTDHITITSVTPKVSLRSTVCESSTFAKA